MRIVKMSGSGNDFVMLGPDEFRALEPTVAAWTRRVCRRGLSVGADGVVSVQPAGEGRVRVRFHNPDGVEAFCGNGTRCAARFAGMLGLVGGESMVLETSTGPVRADLLDNGVRLVLPPPIDLGVSSPDVDGRPVEGRWISAGVPHFVVWVDEVSSAPLSAWGPRLRRHEQFGPEGANVDVVADLADGGLALRTWERGVEGETLACGTGAVAAALAARARGAAETVAVVPASGVRLRVTLPGPWDKPDQAVLEGDARVVFEGILSPEAIEGFPE